MKLIFPGALFLLFRRNEPVEINIVKCQVFIAILLYQHDRYLNLISMLAGSRCKCGGNFRSVWSWPFYFYIVMSLVPSSKPNNYFIQLWYCFCFNDYLCFSISFSGPNLGFLLICFIYFTLASIFAIVLVIWMNFNCFFLCPDSFWCFFI